jgi:hypothetical protein
VNGEEVTMTSTDHQWMCWMTVAILAVGGCATGLEPASGARRVPGVAGAAMAEQSRVRVVARSDAWRGVPSDLATQLIPLLVTVENGSPTAVQLRYEDFSLVAANGRRFGALPPFDIRGAAMERVTVAVASPSGFGIAPYLAAYYPRWRVFGGVFSDPFFYYDHYYPVLQRMALPTGDMIEKVLPEGVLESQARVAGFLYFEEVPQDVGWVEFTARLVAARTGRPVATLAIPFVVD